MTLLIVILKCIEFHENSVTRWHWCICQVNKFFFISRKFYCLTISLQVLLSRRSTNHTFVVCRGDVDYGYNRENKFYHSHGVEYFFDCRLRRIETTEHLWQLFPVLVMRHNGLVRFVHVVVATVQEHDDQLGLNDVKKKANNKDVI